MHLYQGKDTHSGHTFMYLTYKWIVSLYHLGIFKKTFAVMNFILLQMGCRKPNETSPLEPVYPVSTNGEIFPWAQYRLPHSIKPLSYNLTLNPDLVTMTFTGYTTINMLVLHETKVIVLHSSDLNISKASFKVGIQ